ncbi:MAG: metallophosphoesterase [Lentisphaeria bacterium]|nr:metallophosphoesterase [Lentisphaeria bacterium]
MKLLKTVIEIGLEKTLRFLHVTDTHLIFADERDDERKNALAFQREHDFGIPSVEVLRRLDEQLDFVRKNCDLMLYTGDLIDFVSCRNLEIANEKLNSVDYLMAVGNHEFSQYVGEAFEDEEYKRQSYGRVQEIVKNDITFDSRIVGGVNLVALDNSYYFFNGRQLELLKSEVAKGLPIILLMHTPLYAPGIYEDLVVKGGEATADLCDCPLELLKSYSEYRFRQQAPTPETSEFVRYLKTQPLIKAVLAGHEHCNHEDVLWNNVTQYVTDGGYNGVARYIEVR